MSTNKILNNKNNSHNNSVIFIKKDINCFINKLSIKNLKGTIINKKYNSGTLNLPFLQNN